MSFAMLAPLAPIQRTATLVLNKASQMDFVRILRSLEEFLYEVMTWLVFYPRTVLRSALRPLETLAHGRKELNKPEDEQYQDLLSPPLFLMLSIVMAHLVELALHLHPFASAGHKAERLFGSDQNLIILRSLMFASYPLMYALERVRTSKQPLTRASLRGPFFSECYPASVFCLIFGMGGTIANGWQTHQYLGWSFMALAVVWYLGVQIAWQKRNGLSGARSVGVAIACFLKATLLLLTAASALAYAVRD